MAKTVMIPSSDQEMWVCRINHKEYSYPQGTTQTVPDEVAELIGAINANAVKATPEEQATWEVYSQGGWIPMQGGDSLPDTASASAGDVLSLDEDKEPVWSTPSGGGAIGKVVITSLETVPPSWSLDKNYSDIMDMLEDSYPYGIMEDDGTFDILPITSYTPGGEGDDYIVTFGDDLEFKASTDTGTLIATMSV